MKLQKERLEALLLADEADDKADVAALNLLYVQLYEKFYGRFKFGVVTALPKEFAALIRACDNAERLYHEFSPVLYYSGEFPGPSNQGKHKVVLAQCATMGNSASAVVATSLLKDFPNVSDLIMAGIAGGIPDLNNYEKDIRLGDIVVSKGSGLIQYDLTKIEDDRIIVRSAAPKPSARLSAAADELEVLSISSPPPKWHAHISRCTSRIAGGARPAAATDPCYLLRKYQDAEDARRLPELPAVHYGVIGSANSLVKKATLRDELRRDFGVLGVEMEGSGLADGCWFEGRGYLIVRGICDYCDKAKNDIWQQHAACIAMAYVRALFEVLKVT